MQSDNVEESLDGPKAILNKDERKMLLGEEEVADQLKYKRHSRIRKRLRWAISDFHLLYQNWDEINLDKAFDGDPPHRFYMLDGGSRAISTLYRATADSQVSFDQILADGVYRAEADMNDRRVDVRFSADPQIPGNVHVNDAAERITPEDVDSLRIPEMRAVLKGLAHSDADIPELVMEGRKNLTSNGN